MGVVAPMKSFDELLRMTEAERLAYLDEEVEAFLTTVKPERILRLRHLHAKMNKIRRTVKNPYAAAEKMYTEMLISVNEMTRALRSYGFIGRTEK